MTQVPLREIPLYISRSEITTEGNKTGTWRFVRPRYAEKTAPCSAACPAGQDIARIESLICQGKIREAGELILRENPFPATCGRVCFHFCENACNRGQFDAPIAIRQLERRIGDFLIDSGQSLKKTSSRTGKKIAIVGAGPAGLSAAFFLSVLGHDCEVFEAEAEPGGVLRWGIPAYRLPGTILEHEIRRIMDAGVKINCGHKVSPSFPEDEKSGFDAVFYGCGHGRSLLMRIPGEESARDGLGLLHSVRKDESIRLSGRAAVIGGGNTAIDVARTLLRMGVEVTIVYRRRKSDMPAFEHETASALAEGVSLVELASPVSLEKCDGGIRLTLQEMEPVLSEARDQRARVRPVEGKTREILMDYVFSAIGAQPESGWSLSDSGFPVTDHCFIDSTGKIPCVYGGDLTNKVKSVTDAVASGKAAAMAIDTGLASGWSAVEDRLARCRVGQGPALSMEIYMEGPRKERLPEIVSFSGINIDWFDSEKRREPSLIESPEKSFDEIERTFSEEAAAAEAGRCFQCGICNDCDNCRIFCPDMAVIVDAETRIRRIDLDYCKGCGICVVECPRNVMMLEEEDA